MQVISVDATIIISDRYILNVILSSLNLVIILPMLHFALIKLVEFVVIRMYLTMKKMNGLSNGLVILMWHRYKYFRTSCWNGGIFQEGNSRNDDQNLERGAGYFGTWMDSRAMDVNEIFGICETWCFRVDWIREWTWPFTVSSHASQRIYFRDI